MFRKYTDFVDKERGYQKQQASGLVDKGTRPPSDWRSLPGQTVSAAATMATSVPVDEVLAKIRDEVEHEGHGASHIFIILGASVSVLSAALV